MKKLITVIFASLLVSCVNMSKYEAKRRIILECRESADTILAHMSGWHEISSYEDETDNIIELCVLVSNNKDTLLVVTDGFDSDGWRGKIFGKDVTSLSSADRIKRHNLAIKSICKKDSCFTYDPTSSKLLLGHFILKRPKEPERPLEDYGLTEKDIK